MPDNTNNQPKDRWTKIMFGVLVFFGVSALIMGILQLGQGLNLTAGLESEMAAMDASQLLGQTEERSMEDLQMTDTDGDGLSDFEEMYVYKTSIYLVDSDSDGYPDKEEIDGGYDPNCPKGQDCRGITADTNQPLSDANSKIPVAENSSDTAGSKELTPEIKQELMNLSADDIRQLLLESGQMSQDQLSQIDDATLVQMFREVMEQGETGN